MSINKPSEYPLPPLYEIDISEGWDTESDIEIFMASIKEMPFYKPGLLFSGFDGSKIGIDFHCDAGEDLVFCGNESDIIHNDIDSALSHGLNYDKPAIAVYDPTKMTDFEQGLLFKIEDPTALLAIITIKK